MSATDLIGGRVILHAGSMLDVLPTLPADSIDACVTDGPYFLPEIGKRYGKASAAPAKGEMYQRGAKAAVHGKADIFSDICNRVETWREVYRVLKPGAFLLAFNCTKAYHHMATAADNAGFEIRDVLSWVYGTGFPHGKPLGKLIDRRLLGAWCDDDELARGPVSHTAAFYAERDIVMKPATELIMMARKPFAKTIGDNLIENGLGSIDVTGCRIHHETGSSYPSNLLHDGSAEIVEMFPVDAGGKSVARFFWHPKAGEADRAGSDHPTVKPVSLVQYLVRLVSAPGQIVLDPFAGSGTTGEAVWREGRHGVLIEIDPHYQAAIAHRMALCLAGPEERQRKIIKATAVAAPFAAGSLFAGM